MPMRVLPVILTLLLLPLAMYSQVKEVVIKEDFKQNSAGWPEDETSEYKAVVIANTYVLERFSSAGSKTFDIPLQMNLGDNYYFEIEGMCGSGDNNGAYGIVWGKGRGGYFAFCITRDGRFFVRKVSAGRSPKYLLGPKKSEHIKLPDQKVVRGEKTYVFAENKIRVQYANDEIMFFINNEYVGHIPNELYYGNNAGVIVYGKQFVGIRKFGAYGTKKYERVKDYSAAMRVVSYAIEDGEDENGEHLGNGDCRVSPGETIRLAVTMRNQGAGNCNDLRAVFYCVSGSVTVIDQDKPQYLNDIPHNGSQVFDLKFKVSPACKVQQLNFKIDLLDDQDRLAESVPMTVVLNNPIAPIHSDEDGTISFTFSLRDADIGDINSGLPFTMNNADNTFVVIVGVESYQRLPKAKYAHNDAQIFYNYLVKVLNVPRNNVVSAINTKATLRGVQDLLKTRGVLQSKLYGKQGIDLIFYFSGLGACGGNGMEPCLLLFDSDAARPVETGYPLSSLIKALRSYDIHTLTCFFETSFAGVDRDGVSFVTPGSSILSNAAFPIVSDQRTCLMYAAGGNMLNPVADNTSHGLFTHYLLSAIKKCGETRSSLNMEHLFEVISKGMDRESTARRISFYPRMDCYNANGIRLLK